MTAVRQSRLKAASVSDAMLCYIVAALFGRAYVCQSDTAVLVLLLQEFHVSRSSSCWDVIALLSPEHHN